MRLPQVVVPSPALVAVYACHVRLARALPRVFVTWLQVTNRAPPVARAGKATQRVEELQIIVQIFALPTFQSLDIVFTRACALRDRKMRRWSHLVRQWKGYPKTEKQIVLLFISTPWTKEMIKLNKQNKTKTVSCFLPLAKGKRALKMS